MNKQFKAVTKVGVAALVLAASAPVFAIPSSSSEVGYFRIEAGATHPVNNFRASNEARRVIFTAPAAPMARSFVPSSGHTSGIDG